MVVRNLVNFFYGNVGDARATYAEPSRIAGVNRSLEIDRPFGDSGYGPPVHSWRVHVGGIRISASEIPIRAVNIHAELRPSSGGRIIPAHDRVYGDEQFRRGGFFRIRERPGSRKVRPSVSGVILVDDGRRFKIEHVADHFPVYVKLRIGRGFSNAHVPPGDVQGRRQSIELANYVVPGRRGKRGSGVRQRSPSRGSKSDDGPN